MVRGERAAGGPLIRSETVPCSAASAAILLIAPAMDASYRVILPAATGVPRP
jgi:hypothetical protein